MILHFSQIGFTDDLTFMLNPPSLFCSAYIYSGIFGHTYPKMTISYCITNTYVKSSIFFQLSQNFFSFLKIFFDLLKKTSEKFQVLPFLSFRGLLLIELIFLLRSSVVYLSLQTILPLLRSYGDISKVTLSPGRILMKFIRSFPLICASTMWPFSSSTLNIALGSFSTTTPSISITSVFDIFNPPA